MFSGLVFCSVRGSSMVMNSSGSLKLLNFWLVMV